MIASPCGLNCVLCLAQRKQRMFVESWSLIFIGLKQTPVGVETYILEKPLTDKG